MKRDPIIRRNLSFAPSQVAYGRGSNSQRAVVCPGEVLDRDAAERYLAVNDEAAAR